jgi:hypothetical protein
MDRAARAAELAEAPSPRVWPAEPAVSPAGPAFAPLLAPEPDPSGPSLLRYADGQARIFVPERLAPHALAWRTAAGRPPRFAEPAPLEALGAVTEWRATLLPLPDAPAHPSPLTGFAVFASDGMRARYEFAWIRTSSGWRADDAPEAPAGRPRGARAAALDPVAATVRGMWAGSCGRCLRYPLGRRPGSPHLALCRRDCLPTLSAF